MGVFDKISNLFSADRTKEETKRKYYNYPIDSLLEKGDSFDRFVDSEGVEYYQAHKEDDAIEDIDYRGTISQENISGMKIIYDQHYSKEGEFLGNETSFHSEKGQGEMFDNGEEIIVSIQKDGKEIVLSPQETDIITSQFVQFQINHSDERNDYANLTNNVMRGEILGYLIENRPDNFDSLSDAEKTAFLQDIADVANKLLDSDNSRVAEAFEKDRKKANTEKISYNLSKAMVTIAQIGSVAQVVAGVADSIHKGQTALKFDKQAQKAESKIEELTKEGNKTIEQAEQEQEQADDQHLADQAQADKAMGDAYLNGQVEQAEAEGKHNAKMADLASKKAGISRQAEIKQAEADKIYTDTMDGLSEQREGIKDGAKQIYTTLEETRDTTIRNATDLYTKTAAELDGQETVLTESAHLARETISGNVSGEQNYESFDTPVSNYQTISSETNTQIHNLNDLKEGIQTGDISDTVAIKNAENLGVSISNDSPIEIAQNGSATIEDLDTRGSGEFHSSTVQYKINEDPESNDFYVSTGTQTMSNFSDFEDVSVSPSDESIFSHLDDDGNWVTNYQTEGMDDTITITPEEFQEKMGMSPQKGFANPVVRDAVLKEHITDIRNNLGIDQNGDSQSPLLKTIDNRFNTNLNKDIDARIDNLQTTLDTARNNAMEEIDTIQNKGMENISSQRIDNQSQFDATVQNANDTFETHSANLEADTRSNLTSVDNEMAKTTNEYNQDTQIRENTKQVELEKVGRLETRENASFEKESAEIQSNIESTIDSIQKDLDAKTATYEAETENRTQATQDTISDIRQAINQEKEIASTDRLKEQGEKYTPPPLRMQEGFGYAINSQKTSDSYSDYLNKAKQQTPPASINPQTLIKTRVMNPSQKHKEAKEPLFNKLRNKDSSR